MKKNNPSSVSRRQFVGQTSKAFAGIMILPRFVVGGKTLNGLKMKAPSDLIQLGFIGTGKQGRSLTNFFLKTGEIKINAISEVYQGKAQLTIDSIKDFYQKDTTAGTYLTREQAKLVIDRFNKEWLKTKIAIGSTSIKLAELKL